MTDKCWAGINALCKGLNHIDIIDYLKLSYKAFFVNSKLTEEFFERYTLILLCASHTAATWNKDLLANFKAKQKRLKREEYRFLAAVIGLAYSIETEDDCDFYVRAVLTLLCSATVSSELT